MSFSGFDDAIQAYTNEINTYKDQFNEYKNQLMEFRDQTKELAVQGFTEVGVPLLVEALKSPIAQAGIAKAQDAVAQFFTPKVQLKANAPEADVDTGFIPQQPAIAAPPSPWERPPPGDETLPSQDDVLAAAESRVPQQITADMLPEGAGQLVSEAQEAVGRVTSQIADMGEGLVSQVTSVGEGLATEAGQALSQVTSQISSALGTQAQGLLGSALTQLTAPVAEAGDVVSTLASGIGAAAEAGVSALAETGATIGTELAASAAGGGVGLVVGGLIAVGTLIAEAFTHHHAAAPVVNPEEESVPEYQAGLATGA